MNNLHAEIEYQSLIKHGEQLCGDRVMVESRGDDYQVVVLADGLGSGVKANILATLTAKIISTMIAEEISITECVHTMMSTLPVCKERMVAYSTFSIVRIKYNRYADIIQFDNPQMVWLHKGKVKELPLQEMIIDGKQIYRSQVELDENDLLAMFSDGVIHAGVGKGLIFGWQRERLIEFLEAHYSPDYTAKKMTSLILEECNRLYEGKPGDDTTMCFIRIRKRKPIHIMIGPPANEGEQQEMLERFFQSEGKHIVCGGTTATLAAMFLGKTLFPSLEYVDPEVPPIATLEGVDLVTEGVVTLNKVLEYAKDYLKKNELYAKWGVNQDGASRLCRIAFEEATEIEFLVGKAVNSAHQGNNFPMNFENKMKVVAGLVECLKKMGKNVRIDFY